ncbi:MAG: hypothetical protein V4636_24175 [Pseudomonadota bacterium]
MRMSAALPQVSLLPAYTRLRATKAALLAMTRREDLITIIQALSAEEGTRQPTAADWLRCQDEKAAHRAAHRMSASKINPNESESHHGSSNKDDEHA